MLFEHHRLIVIEFLFWPAPKDGFSEQHADKCDHEHKFRHVLPLLEIPRKFDYSKKFHGVLPEVSSNRLATVIAQELSHSQQIDESPAEEDNNKLPLRPVLSVKMLKDRLTEYENEQREK